MADQSMSPSAGLQTEGYAPASTNKRKRDDGDQDDNGRIIRSHTTNGDPPPTQAQDPIQERLLQAIGQANGVQSDDSARTAQAALATPMNTHTYPEPYDTQSHALPPYGDDPGHSPSGMMTAGAYGLPRAPSTPSNQPKPAVGTQEWHQQRKDNHKEVERRRRETINDGINEIAKIVPGCEKNKGSILQRAVHYIADLHEHQKRWDNESATMSQVVTELHHRIDKLKEQAQQSWSETNKWQQRCRDNGLQFDDYDQSITGDTNAGETGNTD